MSSTTEARVAVITGGSSGIGLHAARALRGRGLNVYELSRRAENAEPGVTHLQADVTDEAQVNAAVAEILRREGRIDILINNAGFGISGAIEFTPAQEARRQFDVNFFGMVNMNHAVLPIMRQQGGGRIVNMSSVAAPIAIPFQAYYSASKAAVRTYSLALASEVRPFGIEVCVIMPGDIATGFTAARRKSCDGDDVYHGRIARSVAVMEHDEQTGMSAEYAGQFVARRATQKRAKLGKIQGGTSHNVIAEEVTISGTLRVFSNDLYRTLSHKIAALMQGLETATGAQIDMDRKVRYPSVRNPRELVEQFYTVLDSMDDAVLVEPVMAAEDFAEYQQEIPGLFFFLGVQEPTGTAPLHSSHFNFDERVLLTGVETFKRILECESKCTKKK